MTMLLLVTYLAAALGSGVLLSVLGFLLEAIGLLAELLDVEVA